MTLSSAGLAARFRQLWTARQDPATASPDLLPTRLAQAVVAVVPVDNAGLSLLTDGFRVPIGASSDEASTAERLQFTVNEGPCLTAACERRTVAADTQELKARWPIFAEELLRKTRYRAVVAVPLPFTSHICGALDLMLVGSAGLDRISVAATSTVTEQVVEALTLASVPADPSDELPWLSVSPGRDRVQVWVASGVLVAQTGVTARDALALMRSYAYSKGVELDEIAAAIVAGQLTPKRLAP